MTSDPAPGDAPDPVTWAVVEAVADAEGVDATDLELRLESHVDTEALDRLARHDGGGSWTFTFELPNHDVTVTSDGQVFVDGRRRTVFDSE